MIITLFLIFAMAAVLWFDITRYIIPNWLCAFLLILYPVGVWMAPQPVDWQDALIGMVVVFAIGYIAFARGWMGGGDVKLIVVCSLWVGLANLMNFIFVVAVLGGVFSAVIYVIRKLPPIAKKAPSLPRILRNGEPIPYGMAIALGFLMMMKMGNIPAIAGAM